MSRRETAERPSPTAIRRGCGRSRRATPTPWSSATSPPTAPRRRSRGANSTVGPMRWRCALREQGVGFGDRLGIAMPNSLHLVLASVAAWKLGRDPGARALGPPRLGARPAARDGRRRGVSRRVGHRVDRPVDRRAAGATVQRSAPTDLPDVVSPSLMGICSSGSTGMPKVIVINRPAVYHDVFSTPMIAMWGPVPTPQTILVVAPMYHSTGFTTLNNMLGGDHLVIMQKFDAALIVDVIERHRVSTFTATPTMLKRIADLPDIDERDLSSIEWILQGAAPMPPSLVERWIELIGAERILMAYGMTEALGITALRGDEWLDHRGSVGLPMRGTEVSILGPDGDDAAAGRDRRHLHAGAGVRRVDLPRRRSARRHHRRAGHGRRHGPPRRRRLPVPRRPARRPDPQRRRQRVPGRGRGRADRPSRGRRRRRDRAARPGVGPAGPRDHRAQGPVGAADVRRRGGVRQVAPRRRTRCPRPSRSSTPSPAARPRRSTAAPSSPNAIRERRSAVRSRRRSHLRPDDRRRRPMEPRRPARRRGGRALRRTAHPDRPDARPPHRRVAGTGPVRAAAARHQHVRRRSTRPTAAGDVDRGGAHRRRRPVGDRPAGRPRPAGRGNGQPRPVRFGPGALADRRRSRRSPT